MTDRETRARPTEEDARKVHLPRWLVAIGFGVPLALIALAASPLGTDFFYVMIGIPALLLIWALAGIGAAIFGVYAARRRAWRQCSLALMLPLTLLLVAIDPFRFIRACNYVGDVAHFIIFRPYYDKQIAALPANQKPRLVVFNWGGMVWASRGLVYDETDQVSLSPGSQSVDWLAQASRNELSCEGYSVRPLWAHYYLASFPC
jgi:hypothetical protein